MNIGIDLGTFNSAAAVAMGRNNIIMVESKKGSGPYAKSFPSFVSFDYDGKVQSVGKEAKRDLASNPKLVIWGVKRLIGLSYQKAKELGELERFQYDILPDSQGGILIQVGEECFTPSHILECILREIKSDAENARINRALNGEPIEKAVISVPAYFNGTRIGIIEEAAVSAGFSEIDTIAEPTAAAIAYGLKLQENAKILTFDMGAGTLDVTILRLRMKNDKLVAGEDCTSGEEALGGIDMDGKLFSYMLHKYKITGIPEGSRELATFRDDIESAKIELSKRESTSLLLPDKQTVDFTREELEEALNEPIFDAKHKPIKDPILERCRGPIRVALQQIGLPAAKLDHVLFVGGPTYMPCVRATVIGELKRLGARKEVLDEIVTLTKKTLLVNPMECVAQGAALKSGGIVEPMIITDPSGYGTIIGGDCFLPVIPVNSTLPITEKNGIVRHEPETDRVPISLAIKRAYHKDDNLVYRYEYLGDYHFYINPTGEEPIVDITMEVKKDRTLVTTFTHRQTHQSVEFEKLNELKGSEIDLWDYDEEEWNRKYPESGDEDSSKIKPETRKPKNPWTQERLDKAIGVAQMLISDLAEPSTNAKVVRRKNELIELLDNDPGPNQAPYIIGKMQELLNALQIARVINQNQFHDYMNDLGRI